MSVSCSLQIDPFSVLKTEQKSSTITNIGRKAMISKKPRKDVVSLNRNHTEITTLFIYHFFFFLFPQHLFS